MMTVYSHVLHSKGLFGLFGIVFITKYIGASFSTCCMLYTTNKPLVCILTCICKKKSGKRLHIGKYAGLWQINCPWPQSLVGSIHISCLVSMREWDKHNEWNPTFLFKCIFRWKSILQGPQKMECFTVFEVFKSRCFPAPNLWSMKVIVVFTGLVLNFPTG